MLHFKKRLDYAGSSPEDPNLIALLARDGDPETKEVAMELLEQSRYHDSLVTLTGNPDAREMALPILQRARELRPTLRQTGFLLEVLVSLDVSSDGYGGIAHIIAGKCVEHIRNGSFVADELWDSVLRCHEPALSDTWKILAAKSDDDSSRKLSAVLDKRENVLSAMSDGPAKDQFKKETETLVKAFQERFPVWAEPDK